MRSKEEKTTLASSPARLPARLPATAEEKTMQRKGESDEGGGGVTREQRLE